MKYNDSDNVLLNASRLIVECTHTHSVFCVLPPILLKSLNGVTILEVQLPSFLGAFLNSELSLLESSSSKSLLPSFNSFIVLIIVIEWYPSSRFSILIEKAKFVYRNNFIKMSVLFLICLHGPGSFNDHIYDFAKLALSKLLPFLPIKSRPLTSFDGVKTPRHRAMRIHPLEQLILEGLFVSWRQIWQYISSLKYIPENQIIFLW